MALSQHVGEYDLLLIAATTLTRQPSASARGILLPFLAQMPGRSMVNGRRTWTAWVTLHDHGLAAEVFDGEGARFLEDLDLSALPLTLQHEIRRVAATHYPDVNLQPRI